VSTKASITGRETDGEGDATHGKSDIFKANVAVREWQILTFFSGSMTNCSSGKHFSSQTSLISKESHRKRVSSSKGRKALATKKSKPEEEVENQTNQAEFFMRFSRPGGGGGKIQRIKIP
jgi:hypothetical protein